MNNEKKEIKKHFENIAFKYDKYKKNKYYKAILDILKKEIKKGKILEIGCGTGNIISYLNPEFGVGLDISKNMVKIAKSKNDRILFLNSDAENPALKEQFDCIIAVDLIEHLINPLRFFSNLHDICKENTRLVITSINPFYKIPLEILEKLKLKMPEGIHKWLGLKDIENILLAANFRVIKKYKKLFSLIQVIMAEPINKKAKENVSVIIPCYNEEGNIRECIERILALNKNYEIIVINDGSSDKTKDIVEKFKKIKLISYLENKGKGYAVKAGLKNTKNEIAVILDADMSTPPEELPFLLNPILNGSADFVNGSRFVFPMQKGAMKELHRPINKFFAKAFSVMLKEGLTDTLCGSKAFKTGFFDLKENNWPDFELLVLAKKNDLRMKEVPIHYKARKKGKTKMKTFKHGFTMLKLAIKALK